MSDDIKLPPLPDLPKYRSDLFDREVNVVDACQVEELMQAYALAAVEADRQGRMPSDDDLLGCAGVTRHHDGGMPMIIGTADIRRFADCVRKHCGSSQPAEGQEVSIDISTGDHDAGRRAFGKLTGEVNPSAHGDVWLAEGYINEPAPLAEIKPPDGYAYRYPDGIRFTNGGPVNGCMPTEGIPYWLGTIAQGPAETHIAPVASAEPVIYIWFAQSGTDLDHIQYWTRDLEQAARQEARFGRPPMRLFASTAPVAAQEQPCNHVFEARPTDGTTRASAQCEPVCRKCGYRPAAQAAKGE